MLRITRVVVGDGEVTLHVAGTVVASSADVLENECLSLLEDFKLVRLNLAEVTYVDTRGAEMLGRLSEGQVTIVRCRPLVLDLIEGVKPC